MDDAEIARLRALCEAATPGEWFFGYRTGHSRPLFDEYNRIERDIPADAPDEAYDVLPETGVAHVPVVGGDTATVQGRRDGEFIAEARSALPAALDEIERLRALLAKGHQCPTCDARCYACSACGYVFG